MSQDEMGCDGTECELECDDGMMLTGTNSGGTAVQLLKYLIGVYHISEIDGCQDVLEVLDIMMCVVMKVLFQNRFL
jgi:hypothetical protein